MLHKHLIANLSKHVFESGLAHRKYAVNKLDECRAHHCQHEHRDRERKRGFNELHESPPSYTTPRRYKHETIFFTISSSRRTRSGLRAGSPVAATRPSLTRLPGSRPPPR